MSEEEMIYKNKLYKQLENNEEPDCEDYYLCEIEEKAKAYDKLIDYLKECINFEKSGLLCTSKNDYKYMKKYYLKCKNWRKIMKNNLNSLNDYLFEQLERLNDDENLEETDNFDKEIKRTKAITEVAKTIIDNANTVINATKIASEIGISNANEILRLSDGTENGKIN